MATGWAKNRAAIEKFSGLTFKETMINAIVCMQRGGHSNRDAFMHSYHLREKGDLSVMNLLIGYVLEIV